MLSNEEKKAIEYLKIEYEKLMKEDNILFPLYKSDAKRLIDIIKKQSKEIEELKENNKTLKNLQNDTNRLYIEMIERKNYFERELQKVVDKIKAKIEEVKDGTFDAKIVLQSLLEKE